MLCHVWFDYMQRICDNLFWLFTLNHFDVTSSFFIFFFLFWELCDFSLVSYFPIYCSCCPNNIILPYHHCHQILMNLNLLYFMIIEDIYFSWFVDENSYPTPIYLGLRLMWVVKILSKGKWQLIFLIFYFLD